MTIYMKVTRDKYRLPVAVADSAKELAALCGTTPNAIYSGFSHEKRGDWYHEHVDLFEQKFHEQPYGHYPDGRLKPYVPVESIIPLIYGEIRQYENGVRYTTKAQRTGCSMCGFGIHLEKRPHRFDRLRQTKPKEWEFLMYKCCTDKDGNPFGWGKVLDYIGVGWEDVPPEQMSLEEYLEEVEAG